MGFVVVLVRHGVESTGGRAVLSRNQFTSPLPRHTLYPPLIIGWPQSVLRPSTSPVRACVSLVVRYSASHSARSPGDSEAPKSPHACAVNIVQQSRFGTGVTDQGFQTRLRVADVRCAESRCVLIRDSDYVYMCTVQPDGGLLPLGLAMTMPPLMMRFASRRRWVPYTQAC